MNLIPIYFAEVLISIKSNLIHFQKSSRLICTCFCLISCVNALCFQDDACKYIEGDIDKFIVRIAKSDGALLSSDDSCTILLLDKITLSFQNTGEDIYFFALGNLSRYAQGYLFEVYLNITETLYTKRKLKYLKLLYSNRKLYPKMLSYFREYSKMFSSLNETTNADKIRVDLTMLYNQDKITQVELAYFLQAIE